MTKLADPEFDVSGLHSALTARRCDATSQIEVAWQQRELSPQQSLKLVDELERFSELSALDRARVQVVRSYHLGRIFDLINAVECGVCALQKLVTMDDRLWLCRAYGRIAVGLHSLGDLSTAFRHYHMQIRIAKELLEAEPEGTANRVLYLEELFFGYHNLAHQFFRTDELQQADHYYQLCYALVNDRDILLGYLLVNHSQCYMGQQQFEQAERQANKALDIGKRFGIRRVVVYALPVLAQLAAKASDTGAAEGYLLEGVAFASLSGLPRSHVQLRLAKHYLKLENLPAAAHVLATMDEPADTIDKAECSQLQSELAEKNGDYKSALSHHKQYLAMKEQIFEIRQENQSFAIGIVTKLDQLEKDYRKLTMRNEELTQSVQKIGKDRRRLKFLSERDYLTNLYNRRHFMTVAESSLQQMRSSFSVLSLAVIDIDEFKKINDTYGHQVGDKVLKALATIFGSQLRDNDSISRFGGEEFAIILPKTSQTEAKSVMERLRVQCANHQWHEIAAQLEVTCSIGVAQTSSNFDFARLFRLADQGLYQAKNDGRNKVVVADQLVDQ